MDLYGAGAIAASSARPDVDEREVLETRVGGRPASALATHRSGLYRPELDGIRALAVTLVVAFHAGVASLAGGYIGVDVFFVLSGFLITGILLRDALDGRLSLLDFYARRARRLLPVALLVVVTISVVWLAVVGAVERASLGADARSAALYFSNWHFASQATDYFASADQPSPFVHFWSLSVEEQFYIGWPLVVLLLCSTGAGNHTRRRVGLAACGLLAASLVALAVHTAHGVEARAYFGTDSRIYQLLVGALLAVWAIGRPTRAARGKAVRASVHVCGLLALAALVLLAWVRVDVGPSTRGVLAAFTTAVVLLGVELTRRGPLVRLLSLGWPVYLGRISYGVYLWHWPVTLITRRFVTMPAHDLFVVVLFLSTGLAAVTSQLLETPVRHSAWLVPRRRLVLATGLALGVLVGAVVAPALLDSNRRPVVTAAATTATPVTAPGLAHGTPVPPVEEVKAAAAVHQLQNPCIGGVALFDRGCIINRGTKGTVFVLGDSHLEAWIGPLADLAKAHDVTMYAWISYLCPWQRDVFPTGTKSGCPGRKPAVYAEVAKIHPDTVVVLNRGYDDPNYSRPLYWAPKPGDTEPGRALAAGTPAAVDYVLTMASRLVVVEPWPALKINQRACLATARFIESCESRSAGRLASERAVESVARADQRVGVVDLDRAVCPRLPVCDAVLDGIVTHRDQDHVSLAFARALEARLGQLLEQAGAFPRS